MILSYITQRQSLIPTTPDEIREACHIIGPRLIRALLEPNRTIIIDICRPFGQPGFAEPLYGFTTTIQSYHRRFDKASITKCILGGVYFACLAYHLRLRISQYQGRRPQIMAITTHRRAGDVSGRKPRVWRGRYQHSLFQPSGLTEDPLIRKRKFSTQSRGEDEYSERATKRLRKDPPSVCKDEPKELWAKELWLREVWPKEVWPKERLLEGKEGRRKYSDAFDIHAPPLWPDLLANVDLSQPSPLNPFKK